MELISLKLLAWVAPQNSRISTLNPRPCILSSMENVSNISSKSQLILKVCAIFSLELNFIKKNYFRGVCANSSLKIYGKYIYVLG